MLGLRLFFRTLKFFLGTALLSWLICSPVVGLLALLSWKAAIVFLVLLSLAIPVTLLLISESEIARLLGAEVSQSAGQNVGMNNSYDLAYSMSGVELGRRPALMTYVDPSPGVFVVRGVGKDGAILLSEGLIAILDESELRSTLIGGIRHLLTSEILLQSACILMLLLILREPQLDSSEPRPVVTTAMAIKNLLLFPWRRFYSSLAGNDAAAPPQVARTLARTEKLYGQRPAFPGLFI